MLLHLAVALADPTVELAYQGASLVRPGLRVGVARELEDEGLFHFRPALRAGGWYVPAHSTTLSAGPSASLVIAVGSTLIETGGGLELWGAARAATTYGFEAGELVALQRQVQLGVMPRYGAGAHFALGSWRLFARQEAALQLPYGALGAIQLFTEVGVWL